MCLGPRESAKTDRCAEQRGRGKTFFPSRQLAQESSAQSALSGSQRCAWAPFSPPSQRFWVSSTPVPTKDQQCVFHTNYVLVCVFRHAWHFPSLAFSHNNNTHTYTHPFLIPSGLSSHRSCCCCCCWALLLTALTEQNTGTKHRYIREQEVGNSLKTDGQFK